MTDAIKTHMYTFRDYMELICFARSISTLGKRMLRINPHSGWSKQMKNRTIRNLEGKVIVKLPQKNGKPMSKFEKIVFSCVLVSYTMLAILCSWVIAESLYLVIQ